MAFSVGDVVKIRKDDLLRGGESAKVTQILLSSPPVREYLVEFENPPHQFRDSDRFLFCIYRDEQLIS